MKRLVHTISVLPLLAGIAIAGTAAARDSANTAQIERGKYLATAADCVACHTGDPAKPYAGGGVIPTPFGKIVAPNITPDKETGIGDWTDDEFYKAMHEGVGKHGENLYPAFPYDAFTKLKREDVLAIKAYLSSLAPIKQNNTPNDLKFPFNQRWILTFWKWANFSKGEMKLDNSQNAAWNRGAYLTEALAHCGTCHSPRNSLMGTDRRRAFAGGDVGSWHAYNITPDPISGVGGWSDDDLVSYLRTGVMAGKGGAAGQMGEAVEHSLSKLPEQDLRDMVTYLRSQKPVRTQSDTKPRFAWGGPAEDVTAFRGSANLDHPDGRTLYYGACASCHGMSGGGTQDNAFPSLFRNTVTGAATANNLVMVILNGVHRTVGNDAVSMPSFGRELDNAEVALVANYVLKTYGNPASATLDASQVDALRSDLGEQPMIAKLALPGTILAGVVAMLLLLWGVLRFRRSRPGD